MASSAAAGEALGAAGARISVEELARLEACSVEPIRTPGAIQPHGALIVVDGTRFEIAHVSANTLSILGFAPEWLLGRRLEDVIGQGPFEAFADVLDESSTAANPALVAIQGRPIDAILRRSGDLVVIDLEPSLVGTESQSTAALYAAIHRLGRLRTAPELWARAAHEIRRITHFDHVMIYHFHDDEHGEIVGEELAEGMEPYLGLHYPASDIPPQARSLYLLKLSRVIATSAEIAAELLSVAESGGAGSLDLSLSELRSVSPHHLQFMRNMGQASTMSFSLIDNGRLIGMITCAHRTPRRLPFVVRQGLEILANQVALQLSSIASIARLTRRVEVRAVRTALVAELTDDVDIPHTLLGGEFTIMDLVPADGAAIRIDGITTSVGHSPPPAQLTALTESLLNGETGLPFSTDALGIDHPDLAVLAPAVAGVLIVPLGGEGGYVAWFRDELVQSVRWLGDQSSSNRLTPLSPRNSFSAWSQDVTGTSMGWDGLEAEAAALGLDLDSALFRRAESRLAHVALHDPLTGLPNRRLLMDRLEHALARYARGEEVALLFIDLDRFKGINDALGHEAGDLVLLQTARVLLSTARAQDTVCRIGGDEFVILCEGTTARDAEQLADRILDAMREGKGGRSPITASVGVTVADLSFDSADLLRRADTAMYRAKQAGGDRSSR
jgi:chemotaxis family two-component system sensor kinase Cph1